MNQRAFTLLLVLSPLAAACGSGTAAFGPAKEVPAAKRPTIWDASARTRLMAQDAGSMGQGGANQGGGEQAKATWTGDTPPGWRSVPANPARFRDAIWQIEGAADADCYLTAAVGGGTRQNMARWYSQQFDQAVPEADTLPEVALGNRTGRLAEIRGTFLGKAGWAALIAFVADGDQVMSLKFTAPEAVVSANREKFLALAKSLRQGRAAAASGVGGADSGDRVWTTNLPAGWESLPANPARFRDAVWRVANQPDTDCYLSAAVGGGVPMNLSRWYEQQFGQPVPSPESLAVVELAGRPARLAEIKGTFQGKTGWAALIAYAAKGEQVMSLKFTGPEAVVVGNREKFLALAASLRTATASPDPKAPPIERGQPLPSSHPDIGTAHGAAPAATGPFAATVPAGWTPKAGSPRLLHHTFGNGGEVYVNQLGGTVRGSLDIWRAELALPPIPDAEFAALPKAEFLGADATLLELRGTHQGGAPGKKIEDAGLLVAVRVDDGTVTFCKMFGPAADVADHKAAFVSFCASLRRNP
ncbi:MAG: hypothetical protein IT455_19470 [Planctomycetes bacterium]|nr:hypothetical protein [Planctomycetota bacterium]